MIGINDVWRQFDSAENLNQVTIERYETTYRKLLEQTRSQLNGLILMSPYLIEPDLADPMREKMDAYGLVIERLAAEFDAIFVNVQAAFDRHLAQKPAQSLCADRVHPNKTGHMIIATNFLAAIEFDWNQSNQQLE